jgi:hypothetical protein
VGDIIDKALAVGSEKVKDQMMESRFWILSANVFISLAVIALLLGVTGKVIVNEIRKARQTEVEVGIESFIRDKVYVDGDITLRFHGDTMCDPEGLRRAGHMLIKMADDARKPERE